MNYLVKSQWPNDEATKMRKYKNTEIMQYKKYRINSKIDFLDERWTWWSVLTDKTKIQLEFALPRQKQATKHNIRL